MNSVKWVSVTSERCVLRLRMEERPTGMEGNYEQIGYAVEDSGQGVVFQLWGWAWCQQLHISQGFGLGLILW